MLKGLGPQEPPKPQYYKVACPEGHWLQGQRTDGYQALRCPSCGGGIFVLPRSPLPEPPALAPRGRPSRPSAPRPMLDEGPIALTDPPAPIDDGPEIEWEEPEEVAATPMAEVEVPEPEPGPPPPSIQRPSTPRPRPARPPAPAKPRAVVRQAEPQDDEPEEAEDEPDDRPRIAVASRGGFWEGVKRRRHLILFLAVATLVVGAIGLNVRRQRLQELPRVAELGRTEGLEALDSGEFDRAKELLTRAARAVEALGGEYRGAEVSHEIRDGARQAEIFADLVPERLETILDEARAAPVDSWAGTFRSKYRGRTVALDVIVTALPDGGRGHEVDYRVLAPGAVDPVVARLDFSGFRLFERSPLKVGDRVIFGARLESLERDRDAEPGGRKGWRLTLQPDSGVNLTRVRALEALGMPIEDLRAEGGAP